MDNKFTVRLCHIKNKNKDYGFNLASKKTDLCKYVGKVDFNSAAYVAGLRQGDRIIEVNNKNVSNMNYDEIVKVLKDGFKKDNRLLSDEILLLVIDKYTDEYYRKRNLSLRFDNKKLPIQYKSNEVGFFKEKCFDSDNIEDDYVQDDEDSEEYTEEIPINISINNKSLKRTQQKKVNNQTRASWSANSYYTLI
ncbi:unnamed protein product [Brachionus calyciflorus]|uniref:PDZ domain-containing protein n=1 Tax=Brachionus calyciflorus TaxID=104777 RepID=A0A813TFS6_9BILA|nr:unnamed protein product [Brachionus calyciflorus]